MMRFKPVHGIILLNLALAAGLAYLWLDEQGQPRDLSWAPPAPLVPDTLPITKSFKSVVDKL